MLLFTHPTPIRGLEAAAASKELGNLIHQNRAYNACRPREIERGKEKRERAYCSAVQINVAKGCVSSVLVDATFDHVFWTAEYVMRLFSTISYVGPAGKKRLFAENF